MQLTSDLQNPSLKIILNSLRVLVGFSAYFGIWIALFELSHAFWFLPAGFRFVALVYTRPVYWPVLLLGEWMAVAYLNGVHTEYSSTFEIGVANMMPLLIYATVTGLILRKGKWIKHNVVTQAELAGITLAIITAASLAAIATFTLTPAGSPFLVFDKFSVTGIFSYLLGDVAGVLFFWSTVMFVKSFVAMEKPDRWSLSRDAAFLFIPVTAVIVWLTPIFEWASLGVMFLPILFLALRHGWPGATFSLMVLNLITGLGFLLSGNTDALFDTQIFLVSVGFTGLFLGSAVTHQTTLTESIRKISQRLITTQESERNRIAQDVHDHVGQVLTALTLRIAILKQRAPRELKGDFDLLDKLAAQVFHDVHEIVGDLSPRELSFFGLKRSLESSKFHTMLEAANISYTTTIDSGVAEIPEHLQVALFRISQEALSNIARHSSATRCRLNIDFFKKQGRQEVRLEIQDNGTGFDQTPSVNGHGLQNIEDRVQSLLGSYKLTTGSGGTVLLIALPL